MVRSVSNGEAMNRRVAILISGRGSNMAALIKAAREEDFPAEIALVISNRADACGLEKASDSGVPTAAIESKSFGKDRSAFEAGFESALGQPIVHLSFFARFMRLFTSRIFQGSDRRRLKISPSLLPSFSGPAPHPRA